MSGMRDAGLAKRASRTKRRAEATRLSLHRLMMTLLGHEVAAEQRRVEAYERAVDYARGAQDEPGMGMGVTQAQYDRITAPRVVDTETQAMAIANEDRLPPMRVWDAD